MAALHIARKLCSSNLIEAWCYLQTLVVWLEWVKGLGRIHLLKEVLLCTFSICKRESVRISYFLARNSQTSDIRITRSLLQMHFS